ncbi:hypothetical protein KNU44_gp064 [Mycobacterium phage CicholasNage]|uniref:Uncharacterized protein n=2 Tax=Bronvirus TaxID=1623278 RepID=A0A411BPD1_9CAUD|nr:hypothetical protein KNU44_gp064 [Mycobacterium phage CicholasNage]YP_010101370.1 hypothetical protein KNU48_gp095 [Mycobacterium phage Silverleaf]QAY03486.1 hypothetical protein SEA_CICHOLASNAGE_64 [Mycobacterium phage CicholasNage]QBP29150.1 hypothetical protein SEA_SILVERLEAF_65 [Mycobacterium phage Silverleaf]
MKKIFAALVAFWMVVGGVVVVAVAARAETGPHPVYDQVCMNPAFGKTGVGMSKQANKCNSAVHPSSYGDGPDEPEEP